MVQYKSMKKKLILTAVLIMLCTFAFLFGTGFALGGGGAPENSGTLNVSDANRFVVFTSKAQLDEYCASHSGDLFTVPQAERASYDGKFFEGQALVMFLTDGMSGSIKVCCEGYELKNDELHVTVKEMSPPIHTMDLHYNTLTVAIPQAMAQSFNKVVINSYRVNI